MNKLSTLTQRNSHLVIGLMSGTCTDGIDAALVRIEGYSTDTQVQLLEFITIPYEPSFRNLLLEISKGDTYGSEEICKVNFLLGELSAKACFRVCEKAKNLLQPV